MLISQAFAQGDGGGAGARSRAGIAHCVTVESVLQRVRTLHEADARGLICALGLGLRAGARCTIP